MTRLLAVIHGPAFGGAHNQAARLREPLARRGIESVVALPEEAEAAAERMRASGVEVLTLPLHRLRATAHPVVQARFAGSLRREVRRLREIVRQLEVDVVQAHGVTNPHAALAGHREGTGVVWQIFDTRAPMPLRRLAMPLVLRVADAMTAWGDELARAHPGAERLGERLVRVFPPVDPAEFAPDAAAREGARARLGVPRGALLVGTVGVRNPQKGHEWLVRAAAEVRRTGTEAVFRVLGGPSPVHASHMRSVEEEARALGLDPEAFDFVDPRGAVSELLQAFDVFAMTSVPRSEGMPTAILEAMACAKPVVTTDVGATRELVEDGVTGLVVPPGDAGAIARALLLVIADSELRSRMGEAGLRRAREQFDPERLADLHVRAYEIAIAHRRSRSANGRRG
jgi:glycosyltransferase involved in cell wall biosynthesis